MAKRRGGASPLPEPKGYSPTEVRTIWRERANMRDQRLKKVNHENDILRKENRQFSKDNELLELVVNSLKLKIEALETLRRIDSEDLTRLENALRERDRLIGPQS